MCSEEERVVWMCSEEERVVWVCSEEERVVWMCSEEERGGWSEEEGGVELRGWCGCEEERVGV